MPLTVMKGDTFYARITKEEPYNSMELVTYNATIYRHREGVKKAVWQNGNYRDVPAEDRAIWGRGGFHTVEIAQKNAERAAFDLAIELGPDPAEDRNGDQQ